MNQNHSLTRRKFVATGGIGMATALTGCSTNVLSQSASTTPTISASSWATGTEDEIVTRILSEYDQAHPEVNVVYQNIPSGFDQQLKTEYAGGTEPDVFYLSAEEAPQYMENEALLDMTPYIQNAAYNVDGLIDNLISAFQHQGKTYGIPKDYTPVGIYYNEAHLQKAGTKTTFDTWDDFRTALEDVKRKTEIEYPLAFNSEPRETFLPLVWQNGGAVLNEDGTECVIGSTEAIEALQFLMDLYDDGLAGMYSAEIPVDWGAPALGENHTTAAMGGAWFVSALQEEYPETTKSLQMVKRMPKPPGGERATLLLTTAWAPSATPTDKKGAAGLVKALTNQQGMWAWAKTGTALPSRQSLLERNFYNKQPLLGNIANLTEGGYPLQFGLNTGRIIDTVLSEVEGAVSGDNSADSAMKSAERLINNNILS